MFKLLLLFASLVPLHAAAYVQKIDYAGTIHTIYGNGLGYSIGDKVSGSLYVDISKAVDNDPAENVAWYTSPTGENFVSGYHAPGTPSSDVVRMEDGIETSAGLQDQMHIGDWLPLGDIFSRFMFDLILVMKPDTFSMSDLNHWNLSVDQLTPTGSWGNIQKTVYVSHGDGTGHILADQAIFSIDYLKSSSVPESSGFILVLMGLAGIFMRRGVSKCSATPALLCMTKERGGKEK